jgi:glycosyltransferase involved in cell wall biosynthesis
MSVLALHFVERIEFCIIGDGPERPELEDALEKTGLKSRVHLPGLVQDLPEYLRRLDFFMMTSRSEGLPLALLEAMQQGCIPVVTAVGGINEVAVPEVGIFFEMEKPEKLIAFLEGILAMEQDQLSDLRQKTRQIVLDHFSLEKQIPKLLDLYRQTLSR